VEIAVGCFVVAGLFSRRAADGSESGSTWFLFPPTLGKTLSYFLGSDIVFVSRGCRSLIRGAAGQQAARP